jgi:hypothetical protein
MTTLDIQNLTQFKSEINATIDRYIEDMKNDRISAEYATKLLEKVINQYNRMKIVLLQDEDDDEEDISDDTCYGNVDMYGNYTEIMADRIYKNVICNDDYSNYGSLSDGYEDEQYIRDKMYGNDAIDYENNSSDTYEVLDNLEPDMNSDSHIIHLKKESFVSTIPETEIIIVNDTTTIDYDEPSETCF